MAFTNPSTLIIVLLALALGLSIFFIHRKSKLLTRLVTLFSTVQAQNLASHELELYRRQVPAVLFSTLDRLIQSIHAERASWSEAGARLRASNKILSHNKNKFENILDAMPDAVVVLDQSGNAIQANQAVSVHLGLDREKILNKPISEALGYPEWEQLASAAGGADRSIEISREGPSLTKTLKVTLKTLGETESQWGHVVLIRDITSEVLSEQARTEFIAHVAHELKAPLNTLKSYSEMLADGEASNEDTKREFCNIINAETDRLSGLIGNLLSITKIEMGSLQIQKTRVKTQEFLEQVFHTAEAQKKDGELSMKLLLPDKLPPIKADKDLLGVALLNLLTNAIKYSKKGGTVTLKAEELEETLTVSVIDTGIGISATDLPHIFEKFYRSQDHQVRNCSGHGLGLALAKQIIQLHDGEIQVKSRLGEGSQFTILLKKGEDILE